MTPHLPPSSGRKDLHDLRRLKRAPILSYLQKQAVPRAPRHKTAAHAPRRHPLLAALSPVHWWKWFSEYVGHRFGRRHPFLTYDGTDGDNGIYRLEGDGDHGEVRIALAGDWASGTDEAQAVADRIAELDPHYTVHLGDVYYVGDMAEVEENFLGIKNPANNYQPCCWPQGSRGSFALNGNHEMYALGAPYFDQILPTLGIVANGRIQGQQASFFCLENDYWRIIALDTGYNSIGLPLLEYIWQPDCALPAPLINWLRKSVRPTPDDPRGIVLLSHHQYFSRFDACYPRPARQLAPFFSRSVLWFWGHEHRVSVYREHAIDGGIRAFGRCIGHGGMPVDLSPTTPKHPQYQVEFVDDRKYPNDENLTVGFNGFARLSLRANRLAIDYVDLHGTVVFAEAWEAADGALTRLAVSPPSRS